MVLYDVTSSYYEGKTCPLARFGHDRDGKTGCPIIVYGTLTDADGRPVAVQVYPGNTGDPTTVPDQVETLTKRFGLSRVVLVGDRGMLTQTQIDVLKKHPGLGWISALRSGAIRRLLADGHLIKHGSGGRTPGGDHLPGIPRRTAGGVLQPPIGRAAPSEAPGAAGGHGGRAGDAGGAAWRGRRAGPRRRPRSACGRARSSIITRWPNISP